MRFRLILFLVCSSLSATVLAQEAPNLPFLDYGACPFACCEYQTWTARQSISLRREMSEDSPVIFRIKRFERVKALTGVVVTVRPGMVEATSDTKIGETEVKRGSKLYVLTYLGAGRSKIWFQGKIYEDGLTAGGFYQTNEPKYVWWVKIKNRKGQIGWTNLSSSFDGQDSCGSHTE